MTASRFLFGRYVEGDLRDIRDHVAKDNPDAARALMVRFVRAFRLLSRRPKLGHRREDLMESQIRCWPVGAYLILYTASRTPIEILAVVHGARDIPALMNRRPD